MLLEDRVKELERLLESEKATVAVRNDRVKELESVIGRQRSCTAEWVERTEKAEARVAELEEAIREHVKAERQDAPSLPQGDRQWKRPFWDTGLGSVIWGVGILALLATSAILFPKGCEREKANRPPASTGKSLPFWSGHEYEQGAKAFRSGVSADANPFHGNHRRGSDAKAWLDGWLDAKEQAASAVRE
jgi:ribosome modulation factor